MNVPLIEAVRLQLYKIASSPKALPDANVPKVLPFTWISNSPSADTYKWFPGSFSLITYSPTSTFLPYIDSTSSRTCTQSRCFRKSLSEIASFICCLDLCEREKRKKNYGWKLHKIIICMCVCVIQLKKKVFIKEFTHLKSFSYVLIRMSLECPIELASQLSPDTPCFLVLFCCCCCCWWWLLW